jgi:hypothetical protein
MTNQENKVSTLALELVALIWKQHGAISNYSEYEYMTKKMGKVGRLEYLSNLSCGIQNSVSGVKPANAMQKGNEALDGCSLMHFISQLEHLSEGDAMEVRDCLPFVYVRTSENI